MISMSATLFNSQHKLLLHSWQHSCNAAMHVMTSQQPSMPSGTQQLKSLCQCKIGHTIGGGDQFSPCLAFLFVMQKSHLHWFTTWLGNTKSVISLPGRNNSICDPLAFTKATLSYLLPSGAIHPLRSGNRTSLQTHHHQEQTLYLGISR